VGHCYSIKKACPFSMRKRQALPVVNLGNASPKIKVKTFFRRES